MTRTELLVVRELYWLKNDREKSLINLRLSATNLTPILDSLPQARMLRSRIEELLIKIMDVEEELKELEEKIALAKDELAEKIFKENLSPTEQTLLILRYVENLSFREIARRMHFSLRQVFRLHKQILKHVT